MADPIDFTSDLLKELDDPETQEAINQTSIAVKDNPIPNEGLIDFTNGFVNEEENPDDERSDSFMVQMFKTANPFLNAVPDGAFMETIKKSGELAVATAQLSFPSLPEEVLTQRTKDLKGSVAAGFTGATASTLKAIPAIEALYGEKIPLSDEVDKVANNLLEYSQAVAPDNPDFFDQLAQGAGSFAFFAVPGIGLSRGLTLIPASARILTSMSGIVGAGVSTMLEASAEMGSIYADREKEIGREAAAQEGRTAFAANVGLIFITNKLGVFGQKGKALTRGLLSSGFEGLQEAGQRIIEAAARGDEKINDRHVIREAGLSGIIGSIIGGGAGLALSVASDQSADVLDIVEQTAEEVAKRSNSPQITKEQRNEESTAEQIIEREGLQIDDSTVDDFVENLSQEEPTNIFDEEGDFSPAEISQAEDVINEELSLSEQEVSEGAEIPVTQILEKAREIRESQESADDFQQESQNIGRSIRAGFRQIEKDINKRIRQVTGLTKPSNKITMEERVLLKKVMQAQARGSRVGFSAGKKEAVRSAKEILSVRKSVIRGIKNDFKLTDDQIKKVSRRDIRLMRPVEFQKFAADLQAKGIQNVEDRQIRKQIVQNIISKNLKNTQALRKAFKFPAIRLMDRKQLEEFSKLIDESVQGDEFLSLRKLETVKNTELAGIKTVREAREILAKKLKVDLKEVENIDVGPLDKFRFDTALAEKNPFYKLLVDETNQSVLDGEQKFFEYEKEVDDLVKKARASKDKSLVERLIPSDEIVFEWLESDNKAEIQKNMTEDEVNLAVYLQSRFSEFRDYLVQQGTLEKYQKNYITHIRRGFLETWKEDGLLNAFKEGFKQYKQDEAVFKILEDDTQNILPLEKFFSFAMQRRGDLKPSKNVAKAFKAYTKAMLKKQALDKIVPALDIYAYSLSPKQMTERGLQMDRRLIKFVREWINTKKGRATSLGGLLPQGGPIDIGLRAIDSLVTFIDLGLNIPVGITVQVGEQVTSFVNLGSKQYALGLQRSLTKKGRRVIEKNKDFIGKSPWAELSDTANDLGDKFNKGLFFLFSTASFNANKIHLLGSMSQKEWSQEEISSERKATLLREVGRFRAVSGARSIFGSTSLGGTLTKYKTWAIPIFRTITADLATVSKMIAKGDFTKTVQSREFQELFRATMITALFALAGRALVDDDDDSFVGVTLRKAQRESLTILGAIDPTVMSQVRLGAFLEDLAESIKLIVTLEEAQGGFNKRGGGLKGPKKLLNTLTPRIFKTFAGDKKGKSF